MTNNIAKNVYFIIILHILYNKNSIENKIPKITNTIIKKIIQVLFILYEILVLFI